jgi:hypothetical protein
MSLYMQDFGLSRKVEQVQKHSQTKATLGPIRWMVLSWVLFLTEVLI